MFLLKIMSAQNLPDNDMTKNYKMIAIGSGDQFEFYHDPENGLPMAQISPKEGESYSVELTGNAYVVSETGKTVSSHWARSLWGRGEQNTAISGSEDHIQDAVILTRQAGKILDPHNTTVPNIGDGDSKAINMTAEEFLRRANENDANFVEPKVTYTA